MDRSLDLADLEVRLRRHVEKLAQTPRIPGSRAHRKAIAYIRHQLETAGFIVQESAFTEAGLRGKNLFAESRSPDATSPLLIVGAHFDCKPGTPGADDNASGVAALLELASWAGPRLSPKSLANDLLLAAYDLEEYGMVGSSVHCRQIQEGKVPLRGMISLEMLGYTDDRPGSQCLPPTLASLYPDVGNFIGVCGNERSRELLRLVTEGMKGVPGLPVESLAVPGNGEIIPAIRLSDHSAFWDRNYQALMITDTSFFRNPHYHQASDTPETLDYPFLAKVTMGVFRSLANTLRG